MSQARHSHDHERETESDLLLRVRAGDMDAFAELAERNRGPALVVARGIIDQASAEDVVADSIERLLLLLKRGEGPTYSVRPYFLQMVRNRAIDVLRRRMEIPVDPAESVPPSAEVIDEADAGVVREAFESLPERWQAALWLGVVENCSHAEIGRELDVAEGAATQLLFRAREGLRQSYLNAQVGAGDDCAELKDLFGKYVRGQISPRDARKVDAHLAHCESCRLAMGRTRQLNSRIGVALAVGILGGAGLELLRRPGTAMAAELGPARALQAVKTSRKARHLLVAMVGLAATGALAIGIPINGAGTLADAIMELPRPSIGVFTPSASPTPTSSLTPSVTPSPTPTRTPTPSPSATKAKPSPSRSTPTPSPSATPTPSPTVTPTPTPSASPSPSVGEVGQG